MPKNCEVRDGLFTEYRLAVKEWVGSINNLEEAGDFHGQNLFDRVEEMRFRALIAKNVYENHIADHGCGSYAESYDVDIPA